jgi:protein-glucosylgalactosylhydroxylysine glucosidase
MTDPISPPVAQGARDGALPAYVSNGLIGLRVREQPLVPGMTTVSSVVGEDVERRVEGAAPCPYPLAADLGIDGVWLSDRPWSARNLTQSYDFRSAELTSTFKVIIGTCEVAVEVLTFASRTAPTLVLQQVLLRIGADCDVGIRASVTPSG